MIKFILKIAKVLLLCSIPGLGFAVQKQKGFGDVASSMIEPVSVLNNFIGSAAIVIGIACLFGAFFRYMQYRINPLASPLSSVIFLLVLGLVLIGLPFIYLIIEGIPFTLYSR